MSDAVQIQLIQSVPVIIASIASAIGAYFAYKSKKQGEANHAQGVENQQAMNGHLSALLVATGAAAKLEGVAQEKDRADAAAHQDPSK